MPPIPHRRNRTTIVLLLIIVALLLTLGIVCYRCHRCPSCPPVVTGPIDSSKLVHWAQWNVLFQPGTSGATRAFVANKVDDSLRKLLVSYGIDTTNIHPIFTHYFCPCDPSLLDVDLTLINESGNPVTPSSPTKNPPPGPIGGLGGSVVANYFNTAMSIPEYANPLPLKENPYGNYVAGGDTTFFSQNLAAHAVSDQVLAILDTGLDSTEFHKTINGKTYDYTSEISNLVWKDPSGRTLYNTLINAEQDQLTDDETSFKHGSSVTYVALLAASKNTLGNTLPRPLPHVMVLKVLDSLGRGSVFTISCAMSYAIQKKATVINASLGYSGPSDPILEYYFGQANLHRIPVMVAAGNDSSAPHDPTSLCLSNLNTNDSIGGASPFYPACYSKTMPYITTVTGVSHARPCFYQKFSGTFVNVGVDIQVDNGNGAASNVTCCAIYIPYLNKGVFVEGSSFSTPVVSGSYLYTYPPTGSTQLPLTPAQWLSHWPSTEPNLNKYIQGGKYLTWFFQ